MSQRRARSPPRPRACNEYFVEIAAPPGNARRHATCSTVPPVVNRKCHEQEGVEGPLAASRTPPRLRGWLVGVAIALTAGTLAFLMTHRSGAQAGKKADVRDVPRLDGAWIRFSSDYAKRSKIDFAAGKLAPLSPLINVTGTLTFDPERVAVIGARVAGRVRRILKFPGDTFATGETIIELESVEFGKAQAALLAARARAAAAVANHKREAQLAEARVSSRRDAELAAATAAAATAELAACVQRLHAFGGTLRGEPSILPLASPLAGTLVELNVFRGQSVGPSLTLARVADLSQLWVELAVYESDLGRIREQDAVEISPQTNAKTVVRGTVAQVGDVIDLESRTAPVRIEVDNQDRALRPGQSVVAKIHATASPRKVLLIPQNATISIDGKPMVFVAHGETSVEPRSLVLGARDATRVEVISGLSPSERIAVSGVFALKAETFR
jgi:membrane fusion protein, heavy metal efflux system